MERILVTVITEAVLESALTRELVALGASGYTITDARGRGSRGLRRSAWRESSNIRIEVLCSAELADRLVDLLREKYYDNYAMVSWHHPVSVLRAEKFR